MERPALPLRLTQKGTDRAVLMLGEQDITQYVSHNGLRIDYDDGLPTVTLTFGIGRLDLDFDIDLLERLLADARAKAGA